MNSKLRKPINWTPLEVVSIKRESDRPAKYVLNYEGLKGLLEPIKDKEVAVIPIVGPSRQGKSFILNYMIRYLSDPKNTNWIGNKDEPLKGFGWKSDVDPQTMGLWLSKPFILKKSNGKEIAVLLMDTQGVFDSESTHRDWCTIVGISLLLSSCLIFNLFTNLQEDSLIILESFLQYGLLAAKADPDSEEKPFQNMLFLIRDWNTPDKYKFGLSGGKAFLKHRLEVKKNQSESSQLVRKILLDCFEDISCFLMPSIGEKALEEDFRGGVDGLSDKFVEKMKEFIIHLLNPKQLKPILINGNTITGEKLLLFFKTYVDVFNSDELPKPIDLIEATAKSEDLIYLNKLKDLILTEMRAFIKTKPFVSRKSLEGQFNDRKNRTVEDFRRLKKSTNKEIVEELLDSIDKGLRANYQQIITENQSQRIEFIDRMSSKCSSNFHQLISREVNDSLLEDNVLEDYLRKYKQQIMNEFRLNFGDEDQQLFANDVKKLNKEIENYETIFRTENQRRILKTMNTNRDVIDKAIELYGNKMESLLKDICLTDGEFERQENRIKREIEDFFAGHCFGYQQIRNSFIHELKRKLEECKDHFKRQKKLKYDIMIGNTERLVTTSVKEYTKTMNYMFDSFTSFQQLYETHEEVKQKSLDQFKHSCVNKNEEFVRKYLDQINSDIEHYLSNDLKEKLETKESKIQLQKVIEEQRAMINQIEKEDGFVKFLKFVGIALTAPVSLPILAIHEMTKK